MVYDDADLDALAEAIKLGAFFNSGQDCTAATRIIVGSKVYDNALSTLVSGRRSGQGRRPGDDAEELDMGPLVSATQRNRGSPAMSIAHAATARRRTGGGANGHGVAAASSTTRRW